MTLPTRSPATPGSPEAARYITWQPHDHSPTRRRAPQRQARWRRLLLLALIALATTTGFISTGGTDARADAPGGPVVCLPPDFAENGARYDSGSSVFAAAVTTPAQEQLWLPNAPSPVAGYSVWDALGMSGARWSYTSVGQQKEGGNDFIRNGTPEQGFACGMDGYLGNIFANSLFDGAKVTTSFAIGFRRFAAEPSPVLTLLDTAIQPTSAVYQTAYRSMAALVFISVGIWVMIRAVRSGGSSADEAAAYKSLALCFVFLLVGAVLMSPSTRVSASDSAQSEAGAGTRKTAPNYYWWTIDSMSGTQTIVGAFAAALSPSSGPGTVCYAEGGVQGSDGLMRQQDCVLYQSLVYEPWARGQFGDPTTVSNVTTAEKTGYFTKTKLNRFGDSGSGWVTMPNGLGENTEVNVAWLQLRAQGLTQYDVNPKASAEKKAVPGDPGAWNLSDQSQDAPATSQDRWNIIREYMYSNQPNQFITWQGAGDPRLPIAGVSLVAAVAVAAFVVVTSAVLLLWHIMLVVLFFMLPVSALLGSLPPFQRFFKSWLALWVKTFVWLILGGLVQVVGMSATAGVMTQPIGGGLKAIMVILLLIGVVMLLKKLQDGGVVDRWMPAAAGQMDPVKAATATKDKVKELSQTPVAQSIRRQVSNVGRVTKEKVTANDKARKAVLDRRKGENAAGVDAYVRRGLAEVDEQTSNNPKALKAKERQLRRHGKQLMENANPVAGATLRDLNADAGIGKRGRQDKAMRESELERSKATLKNLKGREVTAEERIVFAKRHGDDDNRRQRLLESGSPSVIRRTSNAWVADADSDVAAAERRRDINKGLLQQSERQLRDAKDPATRRLAQQQVLARRKAFMTSIQEAQHLAKRRQEVESQKKRAMVKLHEDAQRRAQEAQKLNRVNVVKVRRDGD